ncbi:MAG: D-alanine--D-alanine ligase family protein [Rhodoglobus sp.]|uniref:D-alanine--D-alanine ligase family protein n=1 Tax=Salinibacterium sp. G-O1 TaxID=3046208 RepID=UPI0024BA1048|nr:D-alanine--D-alanine ligase family protein [Salinibacterium sp. G-O1]MDJ0335764.1 D-alanine--D-alanine ligase family protein [Salinibacterium sp. G-O1]
MPKLTVALLFGGRSSEHTISCATAGGVLSAIDRDKYDVIPIGITKEGAFTLQPDDAALFTLNPSAMPVVTDNGTRVSWPDSAASRELSVTDAAGESRSLGTVDVVFPILHGPFGEDGTVQGMLELLGLPYVGNGVLASALGMDKHFAKTALEAVGVTVAPWVTVTAAQWAADNALWRGRATSLGLPVFVKPARAGSSVGVTKVTDAAGLDAALATAWAEDGKALIEQAIVGRELECAVLSGRDSGATRVSLAGEIIIAGDGFYDFDAKYLDDSAAQLVCPADLSDGQLAEMQRVAARAFEAIGGSGLARVDFFFTGTDFVVNELNTMPGFTPISMFPKCWAASGLAYPQLIDELIELGLQTVR